MASAFQLGVSGMDAMTQKISVIGNNIANSQTTAYKSTSISFSESFVTSVGTLVNGEQIQYGNGVTINSTTTDWSSGDTGSTSDAADIAITGKGFLPVAYNGEIYYTKAGDFSLVTSNDGSSFYFERSDGSILLGQASANDSISTTGYVRFTNEDGAHSPIQAPTSYQIAADGTITAKPDQYSPEVPSTGTVYGGYTFTCAWTDMTQADWTAYSAAAGTTYYIPTWDATNSKVSAWLPGDTVANGGWRENGGLNKVVVENSQVGLQNFNNPDSLKLYENGLYSPTSETSYSTENPVVPGTSGTGSLLQGSLENSNVDLVSQFTDMIITQRAFQANSKTITTADEMLQTVLQLKN